MKKEILDRLSNFRGQLISLKRNVERLPCARVNRRELRDRADEIATFWVEELRSPLEHKFKIDPLVIHETSQQMKRLHVLTRPNNRKSSYLATLKVVLPRFDDKFILPIKQATPDIEGLLDLVKLVPSLADPVESDYLKEAVDCATARHYRAAIVMGWCAGVDRMQKKIMSTGFAKFNTTSTRLKNQASGKFKHWKKEFSISTLSELQSVFDTDLIVVLEGMALLDANQAQRLRTCFEYRNHSAHPGEAPIEEPHVVSFFTDINSIILQNEKFQL
jgi:hypothetical protein